MRKIQVSQIFVFVSLFSVALLVAAGTVYVLLSGLRLGDFRGVVLTAGFVLFSYAFTIVVYRLFMRSFPLPEGEIAAGSRDEFVYHVYILFFLIVFYPVIRSGFLPTPLMRVFYLALGTRLGHNTYSQGIIHDPPFVSIGSDSVVGQSALIIPHVIEGSRLSHHSVRIGDRVTIGAGAIVLPGVTVGDDAMVAAGAVVAKGTTIGAGERWAGVPARRLG